MDFFFCYDPVRLSEFREIQFNFIVNYLFFYYTQVDRNDQNLDVHGEKVGDYVISQNTDTKESSVYGTVYWRHFQNGGSPTE